MTTSPLRKDAARNWQHIVETGRRFVDEGRPLRLNDVARAASIGVATVYRHFPTSEALLETVARPGLERLVAVAEGDVGLGRFLHAGIEAQLADASIQPVFAASSHALPEISDLVARLHEATGRLLERARAEGAVRAELTRADVVRLMCGVVFAASVHAGPEERTELTRRYLDIVLAGLRESRP